MRRLLWILLAALTIALLILVLQHNEVALDELAHFESASLEAKITAAVLIGLVALTLFRERLSLALEIGADLDGDRAAAGLLGYTYRFELRDVADRVLAELVPGRAATQRAQRSKSCAAAAAISRSRPRSTARASPWCSTPARAPSC